MNSILGSPLLAAAFLTMLAGTAHAQFLTPNAAVTGDNSVFTQGTEVWGGHETFPNTPAGAPLANGVTFNDYFVNATYVADPVSGVSVDHDGDYRADESNYPGGASTTPFGDPALNNVLELSGVGSFQAFDIKGLTPGHTYAVQLFAALTNNGDLNGSGAYSAVETLYEQTRTRARR